MHVAASAAAAAANKVGLEGGLAPAARWLVSAERIKRADRYVSLVAQLHRLSDR